MKVEEIYGIVGFSVNSELEVGCDVVYVSVKLFCLSGVAFEKCDDVIDISMPIYDFGEVFVIGC